MKALFVHDHIFIKYNNKYYSKGKFTYSVLSYYLKYCNNLTVIGRFKEVNDMPLDAGLSEGENIKVIGVPGLLSKNGVLNRTVIKGVIKNEIASSHFVISRLPSELGLLANHLANKINKPILNEMVASPFDCLWYRGDLMAKLYAGILSYKVKKCLKNAENVIYVTERYLQEKYPCTNNVIGISDARVNISGNIKKLKKDSKLRIGIIGNPAIKLKGVEVLLRAFNKLSKEKYILSIVGGSLDSTLEKEMSLNENIEQKGIISNRDILNEWFLSVDIYIQPSYTEGLPRAVIEAMSFNIPVIGSDVGGMSEIVNEKNLFKAGDYKSIVNKVLDLNDGNNYISSSQYSHCISKKFTGDLDTRKEAYIQSFINSI